MPAVCFGEGKRGEHRASRRTNILPNANRPPPQPPRTPAEDLVEDPAHHVVHDRVRHRHRHHPGRRRLGHRHWRRTTRRLSRLGLGLGLLLLQLLQLANLGLEVAHLGLECGPRRPHSLEFSLGVVRPLHLLRGLSEIRIGVPLLLRALLVGLEGAGGGRVSALALVRHRPGEGVDLRVLLPELVAEASVLWCGVVWLEGQRCEPKLSHNQ